VSIFVVDTNVPIIANGSEPHASLQCRLHCVERISRLIKSDIIAIDDGYAIILEYRTYLKSTGQPGVGDAFLRWILTNYANPRRCHRVKITPVRSARLYKEFPLDAGLKAFDPSDRKFVAVSIAHKKHPIILEAIDRGWWIHRTALGAHSVEVCFLCEREIRSAAALHPRRGKKRLTTLRRGRKSRAS